MHKNLTFNFWCFIFFSKSGQNASLRTIFFIIPIQKSCPKISFFISLCHLHPRKILPLNLRRIDHIKSWKLFVDRNPLNLKVFSLIVNLERAQYLFAITKIFAMFYSNNDSIDYLSISLPFWKILSPDFGPIDLCSV